MEMTKRSNGGIQGNQGNQSNQSNQNNQAPAFSGAGGRGSYAGGNINFDRSRGRNDTGAGLSALDDSDIDSVSYANYNRASLMDKLDRKNDIAPAVPDQGAKPVGSGPKPARASFKPARCIVIKNAYDEAK